MIPDVTPNGVFYLPPTGWLTSFYNPPIPDSIISVIANIPFYLQSFDVAKLTLEESGLLDNGLFHYTTMYYYVA